MQKFQLPLIARAGVGLVLTTTCLSLPTHAVEKRAVLKVEVTVQGEDNWKLGGKAWRFGTSRERFVSEITVSADGELEPYNPLSPDYARKLLGVPEPARRPTDPAPPGRNDSSSNTDGAAKTAAIQQKVSACNGDSTCLRNLALEMINENGSQPTAGADGKNVPGAAASEPRFRRYTGKLGCKGKAEVAIVRDAKGQVEHLSGLYDITDRSIGAGAVTQEELDRLCKETDLVVDEKTHTLYVQTWAAPTLKIKRFLDVAPNTPPLESEFAGGPAKIVASWVSRQFMNVSLSGEESGELSQETSPTATSRLNVAVKWSLTLL